MLTVTGSGTSPGTVTAFGRVGATSGDGVALLTYSASGVLLDSDGFTSKGSAGSFQLTVEASPGAQVLLLMQHLFEGPLRAEQGGPPQSASFDMAVNRLEASKGLFLTAASGGLRAIDGGYIYAPIPEPSTIALMLAGLVVIVGARLSVAFGSPGLCSGRHGVRGDL